MVGQIYLKMEGSHYRNDLLALQEFKYSLCLVVFGTADGRRDKVVDM